MAIANHPAGVDHPIFTESIRRIREALTAPDAPAPWRQAAQRWPAVPERDVLERCIHSSGDLAIAPDLVFSPGLEALSSAARLGMDALAAGAPILTDTAMAAAAVSPMAARTHANVVRSLLDWSSPEAPLGNTRSAAAVQAAWQELTSASTAGAPPPVVLIGSAPTALERLLDLVFSSDDPAVAPSLIIGMPVGFVGVAESKRRLAESGLAHIRLDGTKGGAGLVAAACNALLRAAWLERVSPTRDGLPSTSP